MLTALAEEVDQITGLEIGADDYITKPFSPRALVARVRAMLRRTKGEVKAPSVIRAGGLEIDAEKYSVTFNGSPIKLTPNEFKLLQLLASRPGQTLTREQLLDDLHGGASSIDRSVDSHIKNLRRKLETESQTPTTHPFPVLIIFHPVTGRKEGDSFGHLQYSLAASHFFFSLLLELSFILQSPLGTDVST
jgi:DNA-binding response OmpR family regulator